MLQEIIRLIGTEAEKCFKWWYYECYSDNWGKAAMHTKKVIDEAWSNEGILEDAVGTTGNKFGYRI